MKLQWAKKKQQSTLSQVLYKILLVFLTSSFSFLFVFLSQSFPPPSHSRQVSQEDKMLKTLPTIHIEVCLNNLSPHFVGTKLIRSLGCT